FKHAVELATQAKDNRLAEAQGAAKYAGLLNSADVARKAGLGHEAEEVSALDAAEALKKVPKITAWLGDARKRQKDTTTKGHNFQTWLASAQDGMKSKSYSAAYKAATDAYALASNTPALFPRDKADAANRLAFSIVTNACLSAIEGADGDEAATWAQKA